MLLASWHLFTAVRAWCIVCAIFFASWHLFTGVRAQCVVCAMCLASWRLFTGLRPWCAVYAVSLCCWRSFTGLGTWRIACPLSLASWRLFTGVGACCVVSAVYLDPWHLFTNVRASALRVWCRRPVGTFLPVCACSAACAVSLATSDLFTGVLLVCFVCGVLGLLALVHRRVRYMCCVLCSSFVHLVCRRSHCGQIRALGIVPVPLVPGSKRSWLLGTLSCALVVAGGVPLWHDPPLYVRAPRLNASRHSQCPGLLSICRGGFPYRVLCAPGFTARVRGAPGNGRRSWPMESAGAPPAAEALLTLLHVVAVRGPAAGFCLAAPSGVGLGLRALR